VKAGSTSAMIDVAVCLTKVHRVTMAVLGKNIGEEPGPSSFGEQQRQSEITIEPIKMGGWARFGGGCAPRP